MSETNLLRALVLEDEWPTRNYLVRLIEGTHRAEVIGAVATIDEAREALAGSPVDVIFVDVQLAATGDSRTGLDLIRTMAGDPLAPMFVLATASSQHSLEAFDLGVVDYILKPFTEDRVDQCLRRLLDRRAPRPQAVRRVVTRRKKSLVFLDPEKIWAFEAADRLTFVHSAEGSQGAARRAAGQHDRPAPTLIQRNERIGGGTSSMTSFGTGPDHGEIAGLSVCIAAMSPRESAWSCAQAAKPRDDASRMAAKRFMAISSSAGHA